MTTPASTSGKNPYQSSRSGRLPKTRSWRWAKPPAQALTMPCLSGVSTSRPAESLKRFPWPGQNSRANNDYINLGQARLNLCGISGNVYTRSYVACRDMPHAKKAKW